MSTALFVLHRKKDTKDAEVATLAALAERLASPGHDTVLLVADTTGDAEVRLACGQVFQKIVCVAAEAAIGEGADYLHRLVTKVQGETGASLIIGSSNLASRNWGPQVAARLDGEFMGGCEEITASGGRVCAVGAVLGGTVRKTVDVTGRHAVLLYAGEELAPSASALPAAAMPVEMALPESPIRFLDAEPLPDTGGIPLAGASVIVAGGLGVGSAENWKLIAEFAGRIGAAVGASRAAVEMGWAPSTRQVGFSGQKVRPDLYIALGISGAVHHLAGIGGAKRVVAINTDPEANIFKVADVAIVGDYKDILSAALGRLG